MEQLNTHKACPSPQPAPARMPQACQRSRVGGSCDARGRARAAACGGTESLGEDRRRDSPKRDRREDLTCGGRPATAQDLAPPRRVATVKPFSVHVMSPHRRTASEAEPVSALRPRTRAPMLMAEKRFRKFCTRPAVTENTSDIPSCCVCQILWKLCAIEQCRNMFLNAGFSFCNCHTRGDIQQSTHLVRKMFEKKPGPSEKMFRKTKGQQLTEVAAQHDPNWEFRKNHRIRVG